MKTKLSLVLLVVCLVLAGCSSTRSISNSSYRDDSSGNYHHVIRGSADPGFQYQGELNEFDVLAVDAFSSDSIPVHLLTKEAMELYFRHLRPNGILAVHISNRYLDLQPVLLGESKATGKLARVVDTDDDETQDVFGATWVLMANPEAGFPEEVLKNSAEIESKRVVRLWTDDYSNLFRILK